MNEIEARVRCLELAAQLAKPTGDYSADSIVEIATLLYTFAQASPPSPVVEAEIVDKPKRGRPSKVDPFS